MITSDHIFVVITNRDIYFMITSGSHICSDHKPGHLLYDY